MSARNLQLLRRAMKDRGITAYIITTGDAHQSEYVAEYWHTRQWLSGFLGSAGLVVVTEDNAGLWTDGRYFIQAEKELEGSGITLFKDGQPGVPNYKKWLAENLPDGAVVGFDGRVVPVAEFESLKKELARKNVTWHYEEDVAGDVWRGRPAMPAELAFAHELKFSGKSTADKLAEVRAKMKEKGADIYLVAALDDIAWLTNIRGGDVKNTPVTYAYLLLDFENAYLFMDEQKIGSSFGGDGGAVFVAQHMKGITLCPYDEVFDFVEEKAAGKALLYSNTGLSVRLYGAIPDKNKAVKSPSVIAELKAVKNETEIANAKNAFIKDGVVVTQFLKWLSELPSSELPTETEIQAKISKLRKAQEYSLGNSFNTIAAYGENAALAHYAPKEGSCATLRQEGLFLVDTGGQYLDGTTDITRTVAMGAVTDEMKRDYTLVLKAHIAMARLKFLEGATGTHLDAIARQPIWEAGMNFNHGTGHGLGYCLGVHEGPHGISPRMNKTKLAPGMLVSNEPGLYKSGRHGIRTENILLVREAEKNEFGTFLEFETVSLCPIDVKALDTALLNKDEIDWLNEYHRQVFEKLSPRLAADEVEWLKKATESVG